MFNAHPGDPAVNSYRLLLKDVYLKQKISMLTELLLVVLAISPHLVSATSVQSYYISTEGMIKYPILRVDGKRILDEMGSQVLLRGFGIWDEDIFYGTWTSTMSNMPLTVERFQQIKNWGFNTVKMYSFWGKHIEPYEDQPGVWNEEALAKLEEVIQNAEKAGIYFILSVRVQHEVSPPVEWDGWATHDYLLTPEGLQRYVDMWKMLVQRFDKYSNVIGYNPWHCPWHADWTFDPTKVEAYYNTITPTLNRAIRSLSQKIIFYSPYFMGIGYTDWPEKSGYSNTGQYAVIEPVEDRNVVYNFVNWEPWSVCAEGTEWDYNLDYTRRHIRHAGEFSEKYDVPVLCFEFGIFIHIICPERPILQSRLDCLDAMLQIMEGWGNCNWLYWMYGNDRIYEGVLESDLSPSAVVPVIQKYAPTS